MVAVDRFTDIQLRAGSTVKGIPNPADPSDVVPKSYVDAFAAGGVVWHQPVRLATTGAVTLANLTPGFVLDGVTISPNIRILVKDQTNAAQNGIYVTGTAGAPVRASDADSGADLAGTAVQVTAGIINSTSGAAPTSWLLLTPDPITPGVTALTWTQFFIGPVVGDPNAGTGDMLGENNLSEVVNDTLARTNIGAAAQVDLDALSGELASKQDAYDTPAEAVAALGIESRTQIGDTAHVILATERWIAWQRTIDTARAGTLPPADSVTPGYSIVVSEDSDPALPSAILVGVSSGDQLPNGTSNVIAIPSGSWAVFRSDGVFRWWAYQTGMVAGDVADYVAAQIEAMPKFTTSDLVKVPVTEDVDGLGHPITILDVDNLLTLDDLPGGGPSGDVHFTDGDLIVPPGAIVRLDADTSLPDPAGLIGALRGGKLHASSLAIAQTTNQVGWQYASEGSGVALDYEWNAVITTDESSTVGTGAYGPGGIIQIRGDYEQQYDATYLSMTPITFAAQLFVHNDAGHNRVIVPGWTFMENDHYWADGGIVSLRRNDTLQGAAPFIDNQVFYTKNSGQFNGQFESGYVIESFASAVFALGDTTFEGRVGFDYLDINASSDNNRDSAEKAIDTIDDYFRLIIGNAYPGDVTDDTDHQMDWQIALRVPHLRAADHNFGISNASGLLYPIRPVTITAVGNTLPIDATNVGVSPSSNLTLTSEPTIPDGYVGQVITYINTHATNYFALRDDRAGVSSNVRVSTLKHGTAARPNLRVYPGDSITLLYTAENLWSVQTVSNPGRGGFQADLYAGGAVTMGEFFGFPCIGMTDDPTDVTNPLQVLYRASDTDWQLTGAGLYVDQYSGGSKVHLGGDGSGHGHVHVFNTGATYPTMQLGPYAFGTNQPSIGFSDGSATVSEYGFIVRQDAHNLLMVNTAIKGQDLQDIRTATASASMIPFEQIVDMNVATACTYTVKERPGVYNSVGASVRVYNRGAGACTLTPEASVVFERPTGSTLVLAGGGDYRDLTQRAANVWVVTGGDVSLGAVRAAENGDALQQFKEKVATASTTPLSMLWLGDSVIEGVGLSTIDQRFINLVKDDVSARCGLWSPSPGYYPAKYATLGPTWGPTGSAGTLGGSGIGVRSWISASGSSNTRSLTVVCDRFEILYNKRNGKGAFTVTVDGGAPSAVQDTHQAGAGPTFAFYDSGALTLGTHTILITTVNTGGGANYEVDIAGFMPFNLNYASGVQLWEGGHAIAASWTSSAIELAHIAHADPDICFLAYGQNDLAFGGTPAQLAAKLIANADAIRTAAGHDVSMVFVACWGHGDVPEADYLPYVTAMSDAADQYGALFLNFFETFGSPGTTSPLADASFVHPSVIGSRAMADATDRALQINGLTATTMKHTDPFGIFLNDTVNESLTETMLAAINGAAAAALRAPRVTTQASNATWAPNASTTDVFQITAQAAGSVSVSNPSGTKANHQILKMRIKDDGTARTITSWGSEYRGSTDIALPSTTVISKTMYLAFEYNSADTKWDLVGLAGGY